MQQGWWAGVDIGGTKTAVVLSCAPPEIVCRQEFATEPELGPEPAIHRIIAALKEILAAQGTAADSLNGIGISCGGPLDRRLRYGHGSAQSFHLDRRAHCRDSAPGIQLSGEAGERCQRRRHCRASLRRGTRLSQRCVSHLGTGLVRASLSMTACIMARAIWPERLGMCV